MKRATLIAAAAIVLVANAFALFHAWKNRSSGVETSITLTELELPLVYHLAEDDSGVTLNLRWTDPQWALNAGSNSSPWLSAESLREIGFDMKVAPGASETAEFYARQRPRRAFVALEYDGPAWRQWLAESKPQSTLRAEASSHLVPIDAATDSGRLRSRHPDRASVIIVPAVIRVSLLKYDANVQPRVIGSIQEIPSSIHVPLPLSDSFRRLGGDRGTAKYRVHLQYGASLEPWVARVEFP